MISEFASREKRRIQSQINVVHLSCKNISKGRSFTIKESLTSGTLCSWHALVEHLKDTGTNKDIFVPLLKNTPLKMSKIYISTSLTMLFKRNQLNMESLKEEIRYPTSIFKNISMRKSRKILPLEKSTRSTTFRKIPYQKWNN